MPRLISGKLSVENLTLQFPPGLAFACAEVPARLAEETVALRESGKGNTVRP